jgi:hypothetical protein
MALPGLAAGPFGSSGQVRHSAGHSPAPTTSGGTLRPSPWAKAPQKSWPLNNVQRASPPRKALAELLTIGSENVERRFARDGIRAGVGVLAVTLAGGQLAYVTEDESRKANAFSDQGMRVLDLGAVLVARRGARRCLECGETLEETRRPTWSGGSGQSPQATPSK